MRDGCGAAWATCSISLLGQTTFRWAAERATGLLETFLSFKVPGMQNLSSGLDSIRARVTDKISLCAIERFAEAESHGLSLSALVEPSQKAIEEAHVAARALLVIVEQLDADHASGSRHSI